MQFIEKRKWFYIFSLLFLIPGIISMFVQGFNQGIDFKGGTMLDYKMDASLNAPAITKTVTDLKLVPDVSVQKTGNEFYIRTDELNQDQIQQVTKALQAQYGTVELLSSESIGATISHELIWNAFLAIGIALVLMLIYITFRFEWSFGVAAVLALFHDVIIVCGLFSLFRLEVDSTFIAAILTIIGYSINDTIVIFDRVRENLRLNTKKKEPLAPLLDRSIMQTLNRSVNTVLMVLMPLVTLLIFGGGTIKTFVIALLVGFLFGMYSSICVASPLYYEIKQRG